MNIVFSGGERQMGGEKKKMGAGCYKGRFVHIPPLGFDVSGNACLFTTGSPVEKTTVIFC